MGPSDRKHRARGPQDAGDGIHRTERWQGRKSTVILMVCGVIAGFGLGAGILHFVRDGDGTGQGARQSGARASLSLIRGSDGGLSPSTLDAQWLAYSDDSNCADWAGGDGVSAIRLNSKQIAWFFADTYLGPAGPKIGFSHLSGFVHNSVVVQTNAGRRTRLVTLTGGGACTGGSGPKSIVNPTKTSARGRFWDADGVAIGGTIVTFYNAYRYGRIPFTPTGTSIASFPVSKLSAAGRSRADGGTVAPALTPIPKYIPPSGGTPTVWGSAVLRSGSTVYIYGWQSPYVASSQRRLYLAQVKASRLANFAAWRFYAGGQWSASESQAVPINSAAEDVNVASAFSVVPIGGRYWLIQAVGIGDPDIDAYPAPTPWGPFDAAQGILLYRAPGIGLDAADDFRILDGASAEPALSTSKTLVISYNVNSEAVTGACESIASVTNAFSQPRFIAVPKSAFTTSQASVQDLVRAGSLRYPQVTQEHPAQWFNSLAFPNGCPPVPAVSRVRAQARAGQVRLTWSSAGIDMRYRIYLRSGSQGFRYVRTVSSDLVTVTGLTSGRTYDFEVSPVSTRSHAGPAGYVSMRMP
jgi:hypothetical protein